MDNTDGSASVRADEFEPSIPEINKDGLDLRSNRFIWPQNTELLYSDIGRYFDNIKNLLSKHASKINWESIDPENKVAMVNWVDLALIQCLIHEYKIKNIIELGMGCSTTAMCGVEGVHVDSYTECDMTAHHRRDKVQDVTMHDVQLADLNVLGKIRSELPTHQMLFVDAQHDYEFALNTNEEILKHANNHIIVIHDHYGPQRAKVDGEQFCTQKKLLNTHDVIFYSDIGNVITPFGEIVTELLGKDTTQEYYIDWGSDGPYSKYHETSLGMCIIALKSKHG